ncbi:hypothetical protein P154DRAFT_616748 [Amniculicola lignicola CBS 123094]|uniref:Fermentation associated protein n=1 Tax=Amniculicola lignicola CBS 123094 TaxID=1392246 RepID=A0A6A5WTZ4_9PLEO|nr:hypothetical protein P154DRAFT_616748 [Amniculicola lignicola CBS 123094]
MAGAIVSEPLNPHAGFNWVFLIELLICGILTVFFLFYFNRVFATLVSYGIRAYTWHTFHAYIDIQALQISLLGGRIFFKDIRYHGHNETILVHGGHITWNYWLRRVRDADIHTNDRHDPANHGSDTTSTQGSRTRSRSRTVDKAEKGGAQTKKPLPYRITVKLSGIEAFMYNRSPAYDGIIEAMQRKEKSDADENNASNRSTTGSVHVREEEPHQSRLRKARSTDSTGVTHVETGRSGAPKTKPDDPPAFLRFLPIHIDCNKGAIVVGNEHTSTVITAQFEKASGEFDASASGPLDVYQQNFNFQFTHPVVHMKPNPDYKSSQLELAARLKQDEEHDTAEQPTSEKHQSTPRLRPRWVNPRTKLSGMFSKSTDSIHTRPGKGKKSQPAPIPVPGQERWKGLTRYLDESHDDGHGEWDSVEYGLSSLIADCPCVNVSFFWDVPGPVPSELDQSAELDPALPGDINGSIPPDYGMDIQLFGGTIVYGPWADRHRAIHQSIFFPGSHVDAIPAKPLAIGETRVLTVFKLFMSIEDETVLRIPIREPSKDWKWKGKAHTLAGHDKQGGDKAKGKPRTRRKSMRAKQRDNTASGSNVRPFAWIDIKVAGSSSVNYVMDMVASEKGYHNTVDVDIRSSEISSSVNHGLLWRSGALGLQCDLSNPLQWNTMRKWLFKVSCRDLELFLLRDHLFLVTDLVTDWGRGPPSDYFTFVPFQYHLNIDFVDFKLYLNTNDSNIVNNPSDTDDNNFIILGGQRIHGDVTIPLDRFSPLQNEIQFDVLGHDLSLELCMPSKNTLNTFVRSNKVAQLGGLILKTSYTYMTDTSLANTDRLFMDIRGERFSLELYGFLVRHFMKIKDNYFGDDMHFKTLDEYQGLPIQSLAVDTTTPNGQPTKVANDLDVILCISADNVSVMLPANLYSADSSLRIDLPYASADLRFTNYYMDLVTNFSPLSISLGTSIAKAGLAGRTEVFIDSMVISGHRLFGLPPAEPTYVCNWDFDVGTTSGECTSEFIEKAVGAARSFAFSLDDDENALPVLNPLIIHDATFLRLKTQDIRVWLHIAKEAILLSTGPITLDFNDLASTTFSERLSLWIPDLTLGTVDAKSASRQRSRQGSKNVVETHAFLQTTLTLNMFNRKLDFTENQSKQQAHMQEHDQRTNRTQFMFMNYPPTSSQPDPGQKDSFQPPAMQYPDVPHPVFLVQPHDGKSSTTSSGYSSDPTSTHGRQSHSSQIRSASSSSFTHSIRSAHEAQKQRNNVESSRSRTLLGHPNSRTESRGSPRKLSADEERQIRSLPPSSAALSSSLGTPYFPLHQIEPDLTDVPAFPKLSPNFNEQGDNGLLFNDVSGKHFDESFAHMSLLISAEPGIRLKCTPEAVKCMADLLGLVQPHQTEDLLDDFQVSVMSQILNNQKRREGKGKSLEIGIRIPFIHARFQNEFAPQADAIGGKDQYDVILNRLKLATRIKEFPGERVGENTLSFHATLGSLGVSITERSVGVPNNDVAVQAEIRDLLVWVLKSQETSINVNFRALEAATASRKIQYLASIIHRTTLLSNELTTRFEEVGQRYKVRLRYLAYFLTSIQEEFSDPAFLTKASYALRAARDHLRSHDSWKIISRFRYIWQSLSEDDKADVLGHCSHGKTPCPDGAEERVIEKWDKWRTWDLAHVKKSLAMRTLFGSPADVTSSGPATPLHMDMKCADLKIIIDPGPKQSEAALHILAINIAILPPSQPKGLMLVAEEIPTRSTIVQVNSRGTSVQISWEITELVEILAQMFQTNSGERPKRMPLLLPSSEPPKQKENHEIQIIYVTDEAKIGLDTVNLRGTSLGRRFRLSVAIADKRASNEGETTTVLAHLEQGIMELRSRTRPLLRSQFDNPSLYFAGHEHSEGDSAADEIKVAGASRMIKIQVQEDILGFIDVIDAVIRDEVAYFHQQTTTLRQSFKQQAKRAKPDPSLMQLPVVTIALLMDEYLIELALLQSLTWSIAGSYGRVSVVPAMGKNVSLTIDYDLAAHRHRMFSNSVDKSNIISSLELPPVNGRLTVTNTDKETRIYAVGIIETIHLQASEIQALISTINKPEISSVFHAIRDDIEILKTHVAEIYPEEVKTPVIQSPTPSRVMMFNVRMTLSGIDILASAPPQLPGSPTAELVLKLASVQIRATNIGEDDKKLTLPEAVAHLQQISVEMTLLDTHTIRKCGNLTFGAIFQATTQWKSNPPRREFRVRSSGIEINIFADTASAVVDVMNHLQDKIKDLDLSKEKKYLRRLRHKTSRASDKQKNGELHAETGSISEGPIFTSTYSLELLSIQVSWIVGNSVPAYPRSEIEDLVLSFRRIELSTKKNDVARLSIEDMQLQMTPISADKKMRSLSSALLPEVVFHVGYTSTKDTRKVAFQAAGKSLDMRLDSRFILPANIIERSMTLAGKKFRAASATWNMTPTTTGAQRKNPFGNKRLASLLVDANFAGAVVHINGGDATSTGRRNESRSQQKGRYSQFIGDGSASSMILRAPGVALKVEYKDDGQDPSLNTELRIDASTNTLYPTVVPIIIDISDSIKAVVREKDEQPPEEATKKTETKPSAGLLEEENLITADPSAILGRTRLSLGLRIMKQEFSLSCQPIARVAAIARVDDIYVTVNSIKSQENGHFFAASAAFHKLEATVQHVYSRESTFAFDVESIVLSLMNSKHLSGKSGISAILKINPVGLQVNARQLQDFLLFREIWVPPEIRRASKPAAPAMSQEPQEYLMQRYQQVTAATAFPWNANVSISNVAIELDLGQAIGKTSLHISNLWASSKKGTDWEQNLCIGVEKIGIESTGRTSGFVELAGVKVRTSISWPSQTIGIRQTPLIQASVGFHKLRVKAGFDYQAFMIADISNFDFLMYNVREQVQGSRDRLVAILDGDKVSMFCTATSAAQGLALFQAIERLVQENQQAYTQSLKDIEKFLRRKSSISTPFGRSISQAHMAPKPKDDALKTPISLHTDVVVTLRAITVGVYPSTFVDPQIFLLEAADAQARFAVALERGKIHSGLGMTLGKLSVALSSIPSPKKGQPVADLTVEDVVESARSARGGTILRVPKVVASMHTWQIPHSMQIEYVFRSSLEGKVDVGWNYSRISYIRTMWGNHSRTLATRLGKPLPESAVKITRSSPPKDGSDATPITPGKAGEPTTPGLSSSPNKDGTNTAVTPPAPQQEKITAVVNVPQSKYDYTALEPPLIETPQLRDMGEATPPLEWIGLHRDRLPNVTHQIVIVTLLEVAREVEEAYERILGSS